MNKLTKAAAHFWAIEEMAEGDSYVHKLTPFAKLLTTLLFVITVISFDLYDISGLWQFSVYPLFFIAVAGIPYQTIGSVLSIALPFSLFAALSNVLINQHVWLQMGGIAITYGLLSGVSLVIKSVLAVTAVTVLMSTTKPVDLCNTLRRLHVPELFVFQLLLSFRYIRILLEEADQMSTAYRLRNVEGQAVRLRDVSVLLGQLLLRSYARSGRIYSAMVCRGFYGLSHIAPAVLLDRRSSIYLLVVLGGISVGRFCNVALLIGEILK